MALYTKGEQVEYKAGEHTVRAIVRTRHTDGTATVEAQHFLDENKRIRGCYLGYKYRLKVSDLRYSL